MRVAVIVNPTAGRGRYASALEEVERRLRLAGVDVDTRCTRAAGDAEFLAGCLPPDTHAVLVVGGDGTVREVLAALAGRSIPVAILPAGTENLIARACSMSRSPARTVDTILHGHPRRIDLGVINGRRFAIVAGIGFDAEVVARLAHKRRGHISRLDYAGPIWRSFWHHRFPSITVEIEGRTVFEGAGLVFVGVMRYYGGGLRVVRDARWDDGLLDVCILPCATRVGLVMHALRTVLRVHVEHQGVLYRRCRCLRVWSDEPVPVQTDGDTCGSLPVDVHIDGHAGMVLLPRPPD